MRRGGKYKTDRLGQPPGQPVQPPILWGVQSIQTVYYKPDRLLDAVQQFRKDRGVFFDGKMGRHLFPQNFDKMGQDLPGGTALGSCSAKIGEYLHPRRRIGIKPRCEGGFSCS